MILVSACLVGCNCRYDANITLVQSLVKPFEQGFLFPVCPEMMAGFGVPRIAIDIDGASGEDVVFGKSKVIDKNGVDITVKLLESCDKCARIIKMFGIKKAILKSNSPSCGPFTTSTTKGKVNGSGVIASFLKSNGVELFDEYCETDKVIYGI